jgi:adenylosuccinate synthase
MKGIQRCMNGLNSKFCTVLGAQWGDEGKGKLIDLLAGNYDIVARFNGGANAGHTIKVGDKKYFFHLVPSGLLRPEVNNIVGNGCVVDIFSFMKELEQVERDNISWKNRLFISEQAHMTLKGHYEIERMFETKLNLGTTKKAIGTTYATKFLRFNLRFEDLMDEAIFEEKYKQFYHFCESVFNFKIDTKEEKEKLLEMRDFLKDNNMIINTTRYLHENMRAGKRVLAEGANGALLDIDHGTYPFVTSSNTSSGGICTGLGVPPSKIETIIGVVKAYTTRVGSGPFPTELKNEIGDKMQKIGAEFGVTTGRKRRCGWLDLKILRHSNMINGYTSLLITKLDILSGFPELMVKLENDEYKRFEGFGEDISKCRTFDQLPKNAKTYLNFVEEYLETPISWIGVGPERDAIIQKL